MADYLVDVMVELKVVSWVGYLVAQLGEMMADLWGGWKVEL